MNYNYEGEDNNSLKILEEEYNNSLKNLEEEYNKSLKILEEKYKRISMNYKKDTLMIYNYEEKNNKLGTIEQINFINKLFENCFVEENGLCCYWFDKDKNLLCKLIKINSEEEEVGLHFSYENVIKKFIVQFNTNFIEFAKIIIDVIIYDLYYSNYSNYSDSVKLKFFDCLYKDLNENNYRILPYGSVEQNFKIYNNLDKEITDLFNDIVSDILIKFDKNKDYIIFTNYDNNELAKYFFKTKLLFLNFYYVNSLFEERFHITWYDLKLYLIKLIENTFGIKDIHITTEALYNNPLLEHKIDIKKLNSELPFMKDDNFIESVNKIIYNAWNETGYLDNFFIENMKMLVAGALEMMAHVIISKNKNDVSVNNLLTDEINNEIIDLKYDELLNDYIFDVLKEILFIHETYFINLNINYKTIDFDVNKTEQKIISYLNKLIYFLLEDYKNQLIKNNINENNITDFNKKYAIEFDITIIDDGDIEK
jgi:hypothetical protein